jgi:hypothetical protein
VAVFGKVLENDTSSPHFLATSLHIYIVQVMRYVILTRNVLGYVFFPQTHLVTLRLGYFLNTKQVFTPLHLTYLKNDILALAAYTLV